MEFYGKLRDKNVTLQDKISVVENNTQFIPNLHEIVVDFLVSELSSNSGNAKLWQMLRVELDKHSLSANVIRLIKKSNLINPITEVLKQGNREDVEADVARLLELSISHYNKESVLSAFSALLNSSPSPYTPLNDTFIRFVRLNKFNKKSLSSFLLENFDKIVHHCTFAFTSLLITQTDTIRAIDFKDAPDFLVYHLSHNYDKDLAEHFIRSTKNDTLIARLVNLNQSKSVALSDDLLQYLIEQANSLNSASILDELWRVEPDHMLAHIDRSLSVALVAPKGGKDITLQEQLMSTIICVYSDMRSLPTLTDSLIGIIGEHKNASLHSNVDYSLMIAYQHYVTSEQVAELCHFFAEKLRQAYGIEKASKKRKSEGGSKTQDTAFTATATLAELFFMAFPKLLSSVTSDVVEELRGEVQKLADDIAPQYTLSAKEYRTVRLTRCLAVNQLIATPELTQSLIGALDEAVNKSDVSLASEYTQMALYILSRSGVADEDKDKNEDIAKRFLDVSVPAALQGNEIGEKMLGCIVRNLYVLEHHGRDVHLDALIRFMCKDKQTYTSSQATAVEDILTSALFWELSRFRARLTSRVESDLKSGKTSTQFQTLTLLLRFPRGSYTSKYVRNLAIETAMQLEGELDEAEAFVTLRRLLVALLGDNVTVSAKNEEYAIHISTSSTWAMEDGSSDVVKELNGVSTQLLGLLTRPIIRSDPSHFFKKLTKKLEKGSLSMMAASCVLGVYMSQHKAGKESDEGKSKYITKLTEGLLNKLVSDLSALNSRSITKRPQTTIAHVSAYMTCLHMVMQIDADGSALEKALQVAKVVTTSSVHSNTPHTAVDAAASALHLLAAGYARNSVQVDVAIASWCMYHDRAPDSQKNIVERGLADVVAFFSDEKEGEQGTTTTTTSTNVLNRLWSTLHSHLRDPAPPLPAVLDGLRVVVQACKEGRFIRRRLSSLLIDIANVSAEYKHLPMTIARVIDLIEAVVHEKAILLQSTDIGLILTILTNAVSGSNAPESQDTRAQAIFDKINATLLHLIRLRRDICSGHAPSLALLLSALTALPLTLRPNLGGGALRQHQSTRPSWLSAECTLNPDSLARLLEGLTTKTIPITAHSSTTTNTTAQSLKETFARHAYIVLHSYARSATSSSSVYPQHTRSALTPGLYAVCECVDTHKEREFMLTGLQDEGQRSVVKALWKEYDEQRYVGLS